MDGDDVAGDGSTGVGPPGEVAGVGPLAAVSAVGGEVRPAELPRLLRDAGVTVDAPPHEVGAVAEVVPALGIHGCESSVFVGVIIGDRERASREQIGSLILRLLGDAGDEGEEAQKDREHRGDRDGDDEGRRRRQRREERRDKTPDKRCGLNRLPRCLCGCTGAAHLSHCGRFPRRARALGHSASLCCRNDASTNGPRDRLPAEALAAASAVHEAS